MKLHKIQALVIQNLQNTLYILVVRQADFQNLIEMNIFESI